MTEVTLVAEIVDLSKIELTTENINLLHLVERHLQGIKDEQEFKKEANKIKQFFIN